ncbi:MAG: CDP-glucose 4,6-dehydratase [Muribaculaceae bacterium]|nr:CDP-glucose 4,6-dehydratase [Muribaculaceae bacterium]
MDIFDSFYRGKRVLVTGHTGFKGSWLAVWLHEIGAEVIGVGLDPATERDNFELTGIGGKIAADIRADIRDGERLKHIFKEYKPEIVFHLAAQPLVRLSYQCPVETYQTNVMGTINVLEAIRATGSVKIGVMITTDKCYENREQIWGYRENEAMGGYDPYSSSKGAAEIAIASWRRSFFNPDKYSEHGKAVASVRAGNVIGGGDWALDRIIPDCIRALEAGLPIDIRSPRSIRPWQHVLEPLSGYMLLAKKMWEEPAKYCEGWNFGPNPESISTVWEVASKVIENYGCGSLRDLSDTNALHEAKLLLLDISKARFSLGWQPRMNIDQTIELTVDWYKNYNVENPYQLCIRQINRYLSR